MLIWALTLASFVVVSLVSSFSGIFSIRGSIIVVYVSYIATCTVVLIFVRRWRSASVFDFLPKTANTQQGMFRFLGIIVFISVLSVLAAFRRVNDGAQLFHYSVFLLIAIVAVSEMRLRNGIKPEDVTND